MVAPILSGIETTLMISIISAVLATAIGILTAMGTKTAWKPLALMGKTYVELFRNTPLLIQLFFFYKGLPYFGIVLSPIVCGMLALSLQSGAYLCEIFRAGLETIPREQMDSGLSLGFSKWQTYFSIMLPQALPVVIPPMGNQMISLLKNSSLVAFITVPDLFFVIYSQSAAHFEYLTFFTMGIFIYVLLNLGITQLFRMVEKWAVKKIYV